METLALDLSTPVASLTLSRPDSLNAMSIGMLEELAGAAALIDGAAGVRAVVLSGAGRAFSAGADRKDRVIQAAFAGEGEAAAQAAAVGAAAMSAVETMRPAVVAALHGHVIGGGVVLGAACDLRVAHPDTAFCIPEVALGIPLIWGGLPRLVSQIGPGRAKELVMLGREFTAAEAHNWGFVAEVAADPQTRALELAAALAAMPEAPLAATKRHVAEIVSAWEAPDPIS